MAAGGGAWLIKPNRFIILVSTAEQTLQSAVMLARHRLYWAQFIWEAPRWAAAEQPDLTRQNHPRAWLLRLCASPPVYSLIALANNSPFTLHYFEALHIYLRKSTDTFML